MSSHDMEIYQSLELIVRRHNDIKQLHYLNILQIYVDKLQQPVI